MARSDLATGKCRVYRPLLCAVLFFPVTFQYWYSVSTSTFQHVIVSNNTGILLPEQMAYSSLVHIPPMYNNSTVRSVLLAQYTGEVNVKNASYSKLLSLSRPINEAYARRWGYGYALDSGSLIRKELMNDSSIPNRPSLSTYNKIIMLENYLVDPRYQRYNTVLLLDADALVYDFDTDVVARLLPPDKMLVALQVAAGSPNDVIETHNVNIGVTIWNLRHAKLPALVQAWKIEAVNRIRNGTDDDDDQAPLQALLAQMTLEERDGLLLALNNGEINYHEGRYIKHFIRSNAVDWTSPVDDLQRRIDWMQKAIKEICTRAFTVAEHPSPCAGYYSG
jgi:hypothetical protein